MKYLYSTLLVIFVFSQVLCAQRLDTLVNIGGYKMHFNIIKGKGTPILFEAGSGNDGSVWNDLLERIYKVTGTTLITYDRSGFGKSNLNPSKSEDSEFGILNGIEELEIGLEILGFSDETILVSHSYGAFYNSLYAERHPDLVKSIVLIDGSTNTFWNDELLEMYHAKTVKKEDYPQNMGMYYLVKNYRETVKIMKTVEYSPKIPIINIYSENPFSDVPEMYTNRWIKLHEEFAKIGPNVINIVAHGSAHYIFRDNPSLVINAIIKAYLPTVDETQQFDILKKALDNSIELSTEVIKK